MSRVQRYIQQILEIAGLPADDEQGEELKGHITDLAGAYAAEGLDASQATERALQEFGKPEVLGCQLRAVTPLRLRGRDWLVIGAGAVVATIGAWLHQYYLWGQHTSWYDWEPLTLFLAFGVALLVRRPLIGALAPAIGLYLAEVSMRFVGWASRPGGSHMTLIIDPLQLHSPRLILGEITAGHPMNSVTVLTYVSACLFIGWTVARLRRIARSPRPAFDHLVAGFAHLSPFMVLFGLSGGATGVLLCTAVWYWAKDRQTFVARHALQAAVVCGGAVLTQLVAYQVVVRSWQQPAVVSQLWFLALGVMLLRRVFGAMALWAAISAFSGHDFRYPFTHFLFGGGNWRRLRHV